MTCTALPRYRAEVATGPTVATPVCTPGSREELRRFAVLQGRLPAMFRRVFSDPRTPRTIVVVPSMTLDREELVKLVGATYYEERLLCLLLLLRLPAARVVYVTSRPIEPAIVDYYLRLLPPDARRDAWQRLTILCCRDESELPLTQKILDRPALVARLRAEVADPALAHVTCFNVTEYERTLAVRLGVPIYGCDPALAYLGTKSGSRDVFLEAGVDVPPGYGHLRGDEEMADALAALKCEHPRLRRAVVKLEEGFSGEGNAIFSLDGAPPADAPSLARWVRAELPRRLRYVAPGETWEQYRAEFARMGGIVEAFVEGEQKRSPSTQCRIDPVGGTHVISSHDQVLGGSTGQVFLGCTFPAEAAGRAAMHEASRRVSRVLAQKGVVGRFGIDFIVTRGCGDWECRAIEINLRKGGTTHPFLTLQHLTDGEYDATTGEYYSATGRACYYVASDNVSHPAYTNLDASALIELAEREGLHYDTTAQRGVVFHLMGALPVYGKVGALAVGATREEASAIFRDAVALLDRESGRTGERAYVGHRRARVLAAAARGASEEAASA